MYESEESGVLLVTKSDRRLQRRQHTRGVHRRRKETVLLVEKRADALKGRAKRARRNGRKEAHILSGAAKAARQKKDRLARRFQVADNGNGEE